MDKNKTIKLLNKLIPDHGYTVKDISLITKFKDNSYQIEFGNWDWIIIKNNKIIKTPF